MERLHSKGAKRMQKHAEYYATLGHGRLAYIERIVEEYSSNDIKKKDRRCANAVYHHPAGHHENEG